MLAESLDHLGDGNRAKRVDDNGTIHYVGDYYERNVGNGLDTTEVVTKYYYAGLGRSRLVAFRQGDVLYWVGTDHLGGTIRVVDANFAAVDQMRYRPFGEARDSGTLLHTDRKFTGQTEDASIGLYWYGSRAYDAGLGRFTVPDTIVPSSNNPQALNRYSYGYNNPVKYLDPSGHDPLDSDWESAFRQAHGGNDPTDADRIDRLNSILLSNGGSWTDADWQRYTEAKQSGGLDPLAVLRGTVGTMSERIKVASALVLLQTSGPFGQGLYDSFINHGGKVQFGGGPFQRGGTAIGYNGIVYLGEGWQSWNADILAAHIAHESYHAQQSFLRYPYTRGEEVQAFGREAKAWAELRVSYTGPHDSEWQRREDILAASQTPGGLEYFVRNQDIYKNPPYFW